MSDKQADDLRRHMQRLFRRFNVLAEGATPCGKPLSMAHAHALMLLASRERLSQQELGAELCIDKSNVARLCAKMVEAEHVTQRASQEDGRVRLIALTARGKRVAQEVEEASRARFGLLLSALPSSSRAKVITALEQLVEAMEALPGADGGESE